MTCPKGHELEIMFCNFQKRKTCPKCASYGRIKLGKDRIKSEIEQKGFEIISEGYTKSSDILTLRCKEGHNWKTTHNSITSQESGCPTCSNRIKHTDEFVKSYLEKENYVKLSNYENISKPLKLRCPKGHEYKTSFGNFYNHGKRCNVCYRESGIKLSGRNKFENILNYIKDAGYTLLSKEYIGAHKSLDIKCNNGHFYNANYSNFQQGKRCPHCRHKNEQEVRAIFEMIFKKPFVKCRPGWLKNPITGSKLELDGYNEELKIAFEYNGEYHYNPFHGEDILRSQKLRDSFKEMYCNINNVILIVVPYFLKDREQFIREELSEQIRKYV
jgi:hypothetical protein